MTRPGKTYATSAFTAALMAILLVILALILKGWVYHNDKVEIDGVADKVKLKMWLGLFSYTMEFEFEDGSDKTTRKSTSDFENPTDSGGESSVKAAAVVAIVFCFLGMIPVAPAIFLVVKISKEIEASEKLYHFGSILSFSGGLLWSIGCILFSIIFPRDGSLYEDCYLYWSYMFVVGASFLMLCAGTFIHQGRRRVFYHDEVVVPQRSTVIQQQPQVVYTMPMAHPIGSGGQPPAQPGVVYLAYPTAQPYDSAPPAHSTAYGSTSTPAQRT